MITLQEYRKKSELRLAAKDAASSAGHLTKAGIKGVKNTAKATAKTAKATGLAARATTDFIDSKTTPQHRSFRRSR